MTHQTNEELRKKILWIFKKAVHGAFTDCAECERDTNEIMSLIPQPEHSKEQKGNYVSFVNGSGTHCKECGKRL